MLKVDNGYTRTHTPPPHSEIWSTVHFPFAVHHPPLMWKLNPLIVLFLLLKKYPGTLQQNPRNLKSIANLSFPLM